MLSESVMLVYQLGLDLTENKRNPYSELNLVNSLI